MTRILCNCAIDRDYRKEHKIRIKTGFIKHCPVHGEKIMKIHRKENKKDE